MSDAGIQTPGGIEPQPALPVRRLHNYFYCPRLFYYQWVENIFQENADTVAGSHAHRNVDAPSRLNDPKELDLPEGSKLRSLRLESEKLGIVGVVDLVEGGESGGMIVDYKKGSARRNENNERVPKEADAMQVVAHALLLQEQGAKITGASIYYAEEKRRVPVELSEAAYQKCRNAIVAAKALAQSGKCPPPLVNDARCNYCSAYPICLPHESAWWARAETPVAPPGVQMALELGLHPTDSRTVQEADKRSSSGGEPPDIKEPPRPENDEGEVLVVQKPGSFIGQKGEQIQVTVDGEIVRKLPGNQIRAIYLYGAIQMSSQAVETCLELGIDVAYFSPAGRFIGLLRGLPASGVDARLGQYQLFRQPSIQLHLAREVIRAKIHNQRVMLMRNGEVPDRVLAQMADAREAATRADNLTALLGVEGTAAAIYFEQFASMLKGEDAWKFDFRGRNRRPPRDPINAMLSLGYSVLAKELAGVCHAVGLDPFLGFMHQPRYGRPALALDLMEEFRPLIADSVAISLVNRGELGPEDFINSASGTFLNERGRKAFWEAYFRRMDTEVSHPEFGYKMAYRRMFEVQARQLWRYVRGEAPAYHGFTTR
jgi:CRISPR-associated protein Cas1